MVTNPRRSSVVFTAVFCGGVLFLILASIPASGADQASLGNLKSSQIWIGLLLLLALSAIPGWLTGTRIRHTGWGLSLAGLGAVFGAAVGFSPEPGFSVALPALAAAFGGVLACVVYVNPNMRRVVSHGTAASAIPLMLGVYFGSSLRVVQTWYGDFEKLSSFLIVLACVTTVGTLVGRRTKDIPLSLGAAAFGAFVGIAMGLSTSPVVRYVVPTILALFTGVVTYLFTSKADDRRCIGSVLFCFGLLLIIGQYLGSNVRIYAHYLGIYSVTTGAWWGTPRAFFAFFVLLSFVVTLGTVVGKLSRSLMPALGFAALGAGVGVSVGLSHSPVIDTVIPVLLAGVSAILVFLLTSKTKDRLQMSTLLGTFAMLFLLGGFLGSGLHFHSSGLIKQVAEIEDRLATLQARLDEVGEETANRDITVSQQEADRLTQEVASVSAGLEEERQNVDDISYSEGRIFLEGSEARCAIAICASAGTRNPVRVVERVDALVLFEGILEPQEEITLRGESLEISWDAAEGRDAMRLVGWDHLTPTEQGWKAEGEGQPVSVELAEHRNGRLWLVYP